MTLRFDHACNYEDVIYKMFLLGEIERGTILMPGFENDETLEYPNAIQAPKVEFKDTILVPKRPGTIPGKSRSIITLAVKFNATDRDITASGKIPTDTPTGKTSGGWIMEGNVLERSASGMMSFIQVVP